MAFMKRFRKALLEDDVRSEGLPSIEADHDRPQTDGTSEPTGTPADGEPTKTSAWQGPLWVYGGPLHPRFF